MYQYIKRKKWVENPNSQVYNIHQIYSCLKDVKSIDHMSKRQP
jgi:hypothetical protein